MNKLLLFGSPRVQLLLLLLKKSKVRVHQRRRFSLNNLSEKDCISLFRFEKKDITRLISALGIPSQLKCKNRSRFTDIEGTCILLRRLAYPNRLFDLVKIFRRPEPVLSLIFNEMVKFVHDKFGKLLTSFDQWWLHEKYLQKYAAGIYQKGGALQNCVGFIDGTIRAMCRPGKHQKEVYNGHKRVHALKFQSVVLPTGLISHLFGPISGRRHDSYLLAQSEFLQKFEDVNNGTTQKNYCVYGDSGYPLRATLIMPFKGTQLSGQQKSFNKSMSKVRQVVEWEFGKIIKLFAFLDFKKNIKLYLQPIAKLYIVGALLTNCHTCLYGSQTPTYFCLTAPSLESYLSNCED